MTLIYRLPFSYTKEISDRIGCGSAIILRGCFFLFESPEEWCAVKNLLDMSAQHSRGRLFVFDGIASLVDYTLPVDIDGEATEPYDVELSADGAEAMKCLLLKFLDGSYDDDLSYKVSSMMLMRRVYSRLQSNSQMAPSESVESIDSSKAGSHGQDFEWIKMVTLIYNDVCLSQDIKTAEKGFQSLQEVLLSTKVESIPADQWLTLMQMTCTNPPIITLQGSRISSLSLIGRLFLTLMPELSNQSDNWPQLEDFTLQVSKMVGDNLRSGRSTPLFETTVQTVTNMCNVISMSGFNNGQGINFCAWVGDTLLSELEKVGACGGVDATVVLASST
jgi:brefeldin A-resistance guanine nucleotide exchange factor 1